MVSADFDRALAFVLRWEGGKVDNPDDPGGRTAFGITRKTYDTFRDATGQPRRDVWEITSDEVGAIYEASYWRASGAETLSWPLSLVLFDTAVNAGVQKALAMLAESEGDAARYLWLRERFYRRLAASKPKLEKFLTGWLNRVAALRKELAP